MKNLLFVFSLLMMLVCCTSEADRNRMRVGLDSLNVCNRIDQPFTVADVQPYVDYFDRHGNSNDQMLAHYLLGRAYYEAGEAPMALECYHDAIECADTTDADCDFAQLSRVYAQMAVVFYYQGLYREQLNYEKFSVLSAWKGRDTLAALMNYEQECFAYKNLGMRDSALFIIEDVFSKYNQYGYLTNAAFSVGLAIRFLIEKGDYQKAKKFMDIYESGSGRFDTKGNIEPKREIYYKVKGLYYLYNNILDSAEYFFRKELRYGKDFNNQNAGAKGLAKLYQKLRCPDSVAKYSQYAYAMNDSMYAQQATITVERMQAMYNYTRHQKLSHLAIMRASRIENIVWGCIGIILFLVFTIYVVYERLSRKRQEMENKYLHSLEIINHARQDINMLRESHADNAKLIAEKERLIYEQRDYLKTLPIEMPLYKRLAVKGQEPTAEEWQLIEEQVFELYPQFHQFLDNHASLLNDKEYKTCILIRAGFKPKSISNMLNVGPSYISNIRTEMLQTLFNIAGTPKDFDSMIKNME